MGRPKKVKPAEEKVDAVEVAQPVVQQVQRPFSFNILDEDSGALIEKVKEGLHTIHNRRKNRTVAFKSMAEVREASLPIKAFIMQWALGTYGIPQSSIVEIIGGEGIGKTTLVTTLGGWGMQLGCPYHAIECENKKLANERIKRILSSCPVTAEKMLKKMTYDKARSLDELVEKIEDYAETMRKTVGVPKDTPLIISVDPWSKLMNLDESAGYYNYADNMGAVKAKKFKDTGTGTKLGHSQFAHAWCRRLPSFLEENNIVLLMVHHQNAKIDMGGGGASFMTPEMGALYNKTKIGGKAFDQNASIQLILARKGLVKDSTGAIRGTEVNCRVAKNSFGPDNRKFSYEIRTDGFRDTDTYQEPAINFADTTAKWMVDSSYLDIRSESKRFSSKILGVNGVTASELINLFEADTGGSKSKLGAALGIEGYDKTVDNILAEVGDDPAPIDEVEAPAPKTKKKLPPPPPPTSITESFEETSEDETFVNTFVQGLYAE